MRHNARQSLLDGLAYSVMPGFFTPFVNVFAIALGASNYMLGLLASLPALTGIAGQALGAFLSNRCRRRLPVVLWTAAASRAFFALFAVLPFLPVPRAWVFVAAVGLMNLPTAANSLAWTALMGDLFAPRYRGELFGERNALMGAVTILATLVAGLLLAVIRFPYNYTVLNGLSFAFLMLSLVYLARLREPARAAGSARPSASSEAARTGGSTEGGETGETGRARRRSTFRRVWENRPFVGFVGAMLVLQFGLAMPSALYPILLVRMLHMSATWIGLMATAAGLASVLTFRLWGRYADRNGHGRMLALSSLFLPLGCFLYAFVGNPYAPVALEFAFGLFTSGFNLGVFNYVLEVSPAEERPTYLAFYSIATGVVALGAPVFGVFVSTLTDVRTGIALSSAVRVLGVGLLWAAAGRRRVPVAEAGGLAAGG